MGKLQIPPLKIRGVRGRYEELFRGKMETFIVRIYRREKEEIAGIVEAVGEGEKRSFTDIEGLLGILKIGNGGKRGVLNDEGL